MKVVAGLLIAVIACLLWLTWKCQPWLPAGQVIRLRSQRIGNYDFEVWQRKNPGVTEPFATGLFVRKQGQQWQSFLLDFQDTYRPSIELRKEGTGVAVLRRGRKLGYFDEEGQLFRRLADGSALTGAVLNTEPPGNWWLRP